MTSSAVRTLVLALASSALIAAPAMAQEAEPAEPDVTTMAQEAAEEAAELAQEAASNIGSGADADDPSGDPCKTPTTSEDAPPAAPDDPPAAPEDDACADDGSDFGAEGGGTASAGSRAAVPSRQSRRSVLAKGINGGTIAVKAGTKVTQQLLTPTKKVKKTKVLGSATKTARKAGTIRLTIKLNAAGRAFVKAGATKLKLKTVINPAKGRTKTTTKTITITA